MSSASNNDSRAVAMKVGRTCRTIRRWIANGCDIHDSKQLKIRLRLCNARRITKATARELGKTGGQVITQAKQAASRRNGAKGGRPRKAIKNLSHRYRKRLMARLNLAVTKSGGQRYKRNRPCSNLRDTIVAPMLKTLPSLATLHRLNKLIYPKAFHQIVYDMFGVSGGRQKYDYRTDDRAKWLAKVNDIKLAEVIPNRASK